MSFDNYAKIGSDVRACRLTSATSQAIMNMLCSSLVAANLQDFSSTRNLETNTMEFSFRYRDSTNKISLLTGHWLIINVDGSVLTMSDEMFTSTFVNNMFDVNPADPHTFGEAFVSRLNDLYREQLLEGSEEGEGEEASVISAIRPYRKATPSELSVSYMTNKEPEAVENKCSCTISIDGDIVIDGGAFSASEAIAATPIVVINYETPQKLTKYRLYNDAATMNALQAWTVSTGDGMVVSRVTQEDIKTGIYDINVPEGTLIESLLFNITAATTMSESLGTNIMTFYTGGEPVTQVCTHPLEFPDYIKDIYDSNLPDGAKVFVEEGYSTEEDVFTLNLTQQGITNFTNFSLGLAAIASLECFTPNTRVVLNFGNHEEDDTTYNNFDIEALKQFVYELNSLPQEFRTRIVRVSFANDTFPAYNAIAPSVTSLTPKLWDEFVSNLINITGVGTKNSVLV